MNKLAFNTIFGRFLSIAVLAYAAALVVENVSHIAAIA
ncbi:hypothetical protein DES42_107211 [Zavarzinia compransoris]|nr:hypothetical protein DES42_107211 [Zavarzinia compransoris]